MCQGDKVQEEEEETILPDFGSVVMMGRENYNLNSLMFQWDLSPLFIYIMIPSISCRIYGCISAEATAGMAVQRHN
jgi:hypothetical protein